MIQSAESVIIFTGRGIVNSVMASPFVSIAKNQKKSYKIQQACKSIDDNLYRKSQSFFKNSYKNYIQILISPEQHEVELTCVTNSGENIKNISPFKYRSINNGTR